MIELITSSYQVGRFTIPNHPLYEWLVLTDETGKYQQLWIRNITYPEMVFIDEYPKETNYIPKIKEEIIKNHFNHIKQIDELDEIVETIQDMYNRIKKIKETEVSQ